MDDLLWGTPPYSGEEIAMELHARSLVLQEAFLHIDLASTFSTSVS